MFWQRKETLSEQGGGRMEGKSVVSLPVRFSWEDFNEHPVKVSLTRGWSETMREDRTKERALEALIVWEACQLRCWWWERLVKQRWHDGEDERASGDGDGFWLLWVSTAASRIVHTKNEKRHHHVLQKEEYTIWFEQVYSCTHLIPMLRCYRMNIAMLLSRCHVYMFLPAC